MVDCYKEMNMTLSVVIPFRNEEKNVEHTIISVLHMFIKHRIKGEIIAVEDGSSDNTLKILKELRKKLGITFGVHIRILHREKSRDVEVGYAISEGITLAKSDFITIVMGDLSEDPEDIFRMYEKIQEGWDFVIGSRFCKDSKRIGYEFGKFIANRICNYFTKFIYGLNTNDISNAFKMYRREALESINIESSNFNVFVEIPLKLIKKDYKYTQISVSFHKRRHGHSKLKVWKEGPMYFKTVLKIWLGL
jgi:dolichol-phosphate mannosyltransferase